MDTPVNAVYLRFAAPLQSWATNRVTGNIVRTERVPTRSGVVGLVAASLGAPREEWPSWLAELTIEVRSERRGDIIDEFQTINPRDEDLEYQQRVYTLMTGKRWIKSAHFTPDGEGGTSIVRRTYLANAEFIVSISSENNFDELTAALRAPRFSTYLGRKAFAPVFPFYLGIGERSDLESIPTVSLSQETPKLTAPIESLGAGLDAGTETTFKELRIDRYSPNETVGGEDHQGTCLPSRVIRMQTVDRSWRTVSVPALSRDAWISDVGKSLIR